MPRVVQCSMVQDLGSPVDLIFSLATHSTVPATSEFLSFSIGGEPVEAQELIDAHGNRFHRVAAGPGLLSIEYQASVEIPSPPQQATEIELLEMQRPSRYAESDVLFSTTRTMFSGLHGFEMLNAIRDYVHTALTYAPDSTKPTDSAVTTLASGRGVCRDFAHVVIALLRAMDVPARYVSCYAPGLIPMDFHAVAEAYIDGAWYVVDATGLTDRTQLVRIATGRDAADCAFLTFRDGNARLQSLQIDAWVQDGTDRIDPATANDDPHALVQIS